MSILSSSDTPNDFYIIEKQTLQLKTIEFVYHQLSLWRDDIERQEEEAEERLNSQLCKFLNSRARYKFEMVHFNHEEYQTGRRRVDISITPENTMVVEGKYYSIYDPFLVLECKRLTTILKDREKEYVTGGEKKSGGIQRFKLGLHGAELDLVVMIGYVQDNTLDYWFGKVNEWISDLACRKATDETCTWWMEEKLRLFDLNAMKEKGRCRSIHSRMIKSDTKITIHHLWIVMTK